MALQVASHSGLPERILARSASLPTSVDYAYEVTSSDPTEVLAVEIRQYVGGGEQMLVPRLIGQTGKARTKTSRAKRQWTEDEFFVALNELDPIAAEVARKIVHWARDRNLRTDWGSGMRTGGWFPVLDHGTEWYAPIALRTNGKIAFQFARLRRKPPFSAVVVWLFADALKCRRWCYGATDGINSFSTVAVLPPVRSLGRGWENAALCETVRWAQGTVPTRPLLPSRVDDYRDAGRKRRRPGPRSFGSGDL